MVRLIFPRSGEVFFLQKFAKKMKKILDKAGRVWYYIYSSY